MGNLYSLYSSYKMEYEELDTKYSKLKAENNSNKTKITVLNETIEKLENDIVKNKLSLDEEIDINNINKKRIETLISIQESEKINNENTMELLKEEFQNKENEILNMKEENETNMKYIIECQEKIENMKNKILDLENDNKNNIKLLKIEQNKVLHCEKDNKEQKEKLDSYVKNLEELIEKNCKLEDEKFIIKQEIKDIINYYYDNKDIIVSDILSQNNTLIPDYIEKSIIGNIYNCLLNNIKEKIDTKI